MTLTLSPFGGTLGGSRTISVTQFLDWESGTMQGSGHTDVLPGVQFNIGPARFALSSPRVLDNYSTATFVSPTSTDTGISGQGTFNNEPGAMLTLTNQSTFFGQNLVLNFNNFGTVIKNGPDRRVSAAAYLTRPTVAFSRCNKVNSSGETPEATHRRQAHCG